MSIETQTPIGGLPIHSTSIQLAALISDEDESERRDAAESVKFSWGSPIKVRVVLSPV